MRGDRLHRPSLLGCQLLQTHLPLVEHFLHVFQFLEDPLGIGLQESNAHRVNDIRSGAD